ncbi:MAG: hypothetical protein AAB738_00085 [Patescibacteria group bacterium]
MKKLLIKILVAVFLVSVFIPTGIRAQESTPLQTVKCSDFYQPFSVTTEITSELVSSIAGGQTRFYVNLINENDYPIVGGGIYVKIFEKRSDLNGVLVDQFFTKNSVVLRPKEQRKIDFIWTIPAWTKQGEYIAYSYFVVANKVNLAGVAFVDNLPDSITSFTIKSEIQSGVRIDRNNVKINGKIYDQDLKYRFGTEEEIKFDIPIQNETNGEQSAIVIHELYKNNPLLSAERIDMKQEKIELKAKEKKLASYTVGDKSFSNYFLISKVKWNDSNSLFNSAFSRGTSSLVKIGVTAIDNLPISEGKESQVFTCIEGTFGGTPFSGRVDAVLVDRSGQIIKNFSYQGKIEDALKASFTGDRAYDQSKLKVTIADNQGKVVDELVINYDCKELGPEFCSNKTELASTSTPPTASQRPWYLIAVIGVIIVVAVFLIIFKKRKEPPQNPMRSGDDPMISSIERPGNNN